MFYFDEEGRSLTKKRKLVPCLVMVAIGFPEFSTASSFALPRIKV